VLGLDAGLQRLLLRAPPTLDHSPSTPSVKAQGTVLQLTSMSFGAFQACFRSVLSVFGACLGRILGVYWGDSAGWRWQHELNIWKVLSISLPRARCIANQTDT